MTIGTRDGNTATMEPAEFNRRFLMHLRPSGYVKIRHSGRLPIAHPFGTGGWMIGHSAWMSVFVAGCIVSPEQPGPYHGDDGGLADGLVRDGGDVVVAPDAAVDAAVDARAWDGGVEGPTDSDTRARDLGVVDLFVCCGANDSSCGFAAEAAACDGTFFARLSTCEPNPCGPPADDRCFPDEVGPAGARNDEAAAATEMIPIAPGAEHFAAEGVICNVDGPDLDWYEFPVANGDWNLCVTADFDAAAGDLSLSLYKGGNNPIDEIPCAGDQDCSDDLVRVSRRCLLPEGVCGCDVDDDCDVNGNGLDPEDGRCANHRCTTPLLRSSTDGAPEIIDVRRGQLGAGNHLVLVEGVDAAENTYRLSVVVDDQQGVCAADPHEPNDVQADATDLGSGQTGACDAWLCANEAQAGDWYAFDVLPDALDRTVVLTYQGNVGGRPALLFVFEDETFERPGAVPIDPRQECANIDVGPLGGRVFLNVHGDPRVQTIHYGLRIRPTDLSLEPDGRCDEIAGNPTSVWSFAIP